jgi:hypothetical protein
MTDQLLTYPELAEVLGRSEEAVRQLAKRRRWRRIISNEDGRARVAVPQEFLDAPRPLVEPRTTDRTTPEQPEDDRPNDGSADARALLAMLEMRVAEMGGELKEARAEAKLAQEAVNRGHEIIVELTAKAARVDGLEATLTAERERMADIRAERDRLLAQAERLATTPAPAPAPAPESRRGWWPFRRQA